MFCFLNGGTRPIITSNPNIIARSIVCPIKFSLSTTKQKQKQKQKTNVQIIKQGLLKNFVFLTKVGILVHLNCRFLLFVGGEFHPNSNNCYNYTKYKLQYKL